MGMYGNKLSYVSESINRNNDKVFFEESLGIITEGMNGKQLIEKIRSVIHSFITFLKEKITEIKKIFEEKFKSRKEKKNILDEKIKESKSNNMQDRMKIYSDEMNKVEEKEIEYFEYFNFKEYFDDAEKLMDNMKDNEFADKKYIDKYDKLADNMSELSQTIINAAKDSQKLKTKVIVSTISEVDKVMNIINDINKKYDNIMSEDLDEVVEGYSEVLKYFEDFESNGLKELASNVAKYEEAADEYYAASKIISKMIPALRDLNSSIMVLKQTILSITMYNTVAQSTMF